MIYRKMVAVKQNNEKGLKLMSTEVTHLHSPFSADELLNSLHTAML